MSGRVSSRRPRYRDALRTGAVLLCRMSDTRNSLATCRSHEMQVRSPGASVWYFAEENSVLLPSTSVSGVGLHAFEHWAPSMIFWRCPA